MAEEWQGRRDVALIREPHAVNTAENAVRSLELVRTIDGASEVVLVCSIRHFPRVRFLFDRLYRRHGYATRYRYVVRPLPSLPLVRHELCRSPAWRGIGAGRCGCWTRPTRADARAARARRAARAMAACLAGDGNSVAMGLLFYPRGGSAQVASYLSRALVAARLARDARVRIARRRSGALGNAETFFAGIDTVPAAYDDAVARWQRGEDPMDAPFPMHPSYEERDGVPDRSFPRVSPAQGERDGRGLGEADRRIGRAAARAASCTCTTSRRSTRPPRRVLPDVPDRDAPARHRAQDARRDRARAPGVGQGPHAALVGRAHGRGGARARPRRS